MCGDREMKKRQLSDLLQSHLVAYMCLTTHNNIHLQTVSSFTVTLSLLSLVVFMYSSVDLVLYCCNVYLNLFIFYSSLRFICSVLLC